MLGKELTGDRFVGEGAEEVCVGRARREACAQLAGQLARGDRVVLGRRNQNRVFESTPLQVGAEGGAVRPRSGYRTVPSASPLWAWGGRSDEGGDTQASECTNRAEDEWAVARDERRRATRPRVRSAISRLNQSLRPCDPPARRGASNGSVRRRSSRSWRRPSRAASVLVRSRALVRGA